METDKLLVINGEPNLQTRLGLLVQHGFIGEASELIRGLLRVRVVTFYYNWHSSDFCAPLQRVTEGRSGVYVVITAASLIDHSADKGGENKHDIVFEFGWEERVLSWDQDSRISFARAILAQAIIRPVNQGSLQTVEGNGRVANLPLLANYPEARAIAVYRVVYHLREARFANTATWFAGVHGFPAGTYGSVAMRSKLFVVWAVDRLAALSWSPSCIRKELLEWMYLKLETSVEMFAAVAQSQVFEDGDIARAIAVRRWVCRNLDTLISSFDKVPERLDAIRWLLKISQFDSEDDDWMIEAFAKALTAGRLTEVRTFFEVFREDCLSFITFNQVLWWAIDTAETERNYGMVVALTRYSGGTPRQDYVEVVNIRGLSTELE